MFKVNNREPQHAQPEFICAIPVYIYTGLKNSRGVCYKNNAVFYSK